MRPKKNERPGEKSAGELFVRGTNALALPSASQCPILINHPPFSDGQGHQATQSARDGPTDDRVGPRNDVTSAVYAGTRLVGHY